MSFLRLVRIACIHPRVVKYSMLSIWCFLRLVFFFHFFSSGPQIEDRRVLQRLVQGGQGLAVSFPSQFLPPTCPVSSRPLPYPLLLTFAVLYRCFLVGVMVCLTTCGLG